MNIIKIPAVTRISNHVIRILGCNPGPMTLQGTNTYLVGTGNERILIDTGDSGVPQYLKNLESVLKKEKADISEIILTHWHHDHIGGVKDIVRNRKCRVWKYDRSDDSDLFDVIPSCIKIDKLRNGQFFHTEGATLKIVHTPGHTTDHVVLFLDDGSLFSGDCILGEGTTVFEDLYDYMKSLDIILDLKPKIIYPGHGNIIENPTERIMYYIKHREEREKQIIEVFRKHSNKTFTTMEIVDLVYLDLHENLKEAAAFNVNHHLIKLNKSGLLIALKKNNRKEWGLKINKSCL